MQGIKTPWGVFFVKRLLFIIMVKARVVYKKKLLKNTPTSVNSDHNKT